MKKLSSEDWIWCLFECGFNTKEDRDTFNRKWKYSYIVYRVKISCSQCRFQTWNAILLLFIWIMNTPSNEIYESQVLYHNVVWNYALHYRQIHYISGYEKSNFKSWIIGNLYVKIFACLEKDPSWVRKSLELCFLRPDLNFFLEFLKIFWFTISLILQITIL